MKREKGLKEEKKGQEPNLRPTVTLKQLQEHLGGTTPLHHICGVKCIQAHLITPNIN